MVHRVDHVHQLPCALAVAERGERHRRPDRGVRVLAAVLAHAGHVAADVARVRPALVERRIEQLDQPVLAPHQARIQRVHRRRARVPARRRPTAPTSSARSSRSGIRRSRPSRAACRRRSRRAGTTRRPRRALRGAGAAARARSRSAPRRRRRRAGAPAARTARSTSHRKKPSHTLSPCPRWPTRFMPSFQSPAPISGRPCAPKRSPAHGARRVLVQARGLRRADRQVVVRLLVRIDRAAFEEGHRLVEHAGVAGRLDVAAQRERQPQVVVGAARAHAAARRRMPPVLHVAFDELAARAQQQVLAQQRRLRVHQRHRVLQLVAEAEGAARLVVAAARPHAAGERLVQQPAVGQHVERRVGRAHLHRAERVAPVLRAPRRAPRAPRRRRGSAAPAGRPRRCCGPCRGGRRSRATRPGVQLDRHLDRGARIERRADPARQARAAERRRAGAACRCGR